MSTISKEKESKLSHEALLETVEYDEFTGAFIWKKTKCSKFVGARADHPTRNSYSVVTINRCRYLAHRLAFLYITGSFPSGEVDHINRVRSDNRFSNLRDISRAENMQNVGIRHRAISGFQGVSERLDIASGNKWRAMITKNKKKIHLGYFATKEDAHAAYILAKQKLHKCDSTVGDTCVGTPRKIDTKPSLVGEVFGRLTVIRFSHTANELNYWTTQCSCGNEVIVPTAQLKCGNTKSCGCYAKERRLEGNKLRRQREAEQRINHE